MSAASWLAEPWVHRLGWTLIQFLWQGAVIASVFAVVRATVGRSLSSRGRYGLACGALALMVLAPLVTFAAGAGVSGGVSARRLVPTAGLDSFMPSLVVVWSVGVLACSVRLLGGWLVTQRLRIAGVRPAPDDWQAMFEQLVRRLDVSQRVTLLVSSRVDVPIVVGWLRPVVLVPVGALTGLPTEYVTALLAHELAHVCRRDYLVNLLQRVAEALLFYHPAVWWVSGQIRVEREMCCDDMAVAAQGDPVVYARALAGLDASRAASRALEMAADGPSLLDRVRRLLGHTLSPWQLLPGPGGLAAIAVLWLVGMAAVTARVERPAPIATSAIAPSARTDNAGRASGLVATALLGPIGPPPSQTARPVAPAPGRAGVVESSDTPSPEINDQPSSIRGRVTSATTGLPLRNAKVRLSPRSSAADRGLITITDDDGRYELIGVTPGKYDVTAEKAGFVERSYGSRSPLTPGTQLEAGSGQALEKIDVALPAGGVITGILLDAAGDPLAGAVVSARMAEFVNGVPRPTSFDVASDVTDDLGRYRLFGLEMEAYFVSAALPNSAAGKPDLSRGSPVVFFPGTSRLTEAMPLRIEIGRDLTVPPFTFVTLRTAKVSGAVTRQDGKPTGDVSVVLLPAGSPLALHGYGPRAETFNSVFAFPRVAPGEYTLIARSEDAVMEATATFVVDGGDVTIPLVLRKMSALRGRLTFDVTSANESTAQSSTFVSARDDGGGLALVVPVRTDGTFEITGLSGRKRFDVMLPPGWGLKSARAGNQDLMELPLEFDGQDINNVELRLTQRVTVISGQVSGLQLDSGQGVVLIFPEEPERWPGLSSFRTKLVPIDNGGRYRAEGLVPGRYLAVALESFARDNLLALERLVPVATAVTIPEGGQRALDLRLVSR